MPLYEYECDVQHHRFEVIQKFSDAPPATCPTCGSPVHKLVSSPAFQFKGTGWYITDYAKKDSGGETGGKSDKDKDTSPAPTEKSDKSDKSEKKESAPKAESTASTDTKSST